MSSLTKYQSVISNSIIRSSYTLTQVEENIIYLVLAKMNSKEPSDREFYEVSIEDYAALKQISVEDSYKVIAEAIQGLFNRTLVIPLDGKKSLVARWIQAYTKEEGKIQIKWSNDILPYITELKTRFTRLPTKEMINIDGIYAKRLAQLIVEAQEISKKYSGKTNGSVEIDIQSIIEQWSIPQSYHEYKVLKSKLLVPAMKEVEKRLKIVLSLIDKEGRCKEGRRVKRVWVVF